MSTNHNPVLLIGAHRSGTTLVASLLANHEEACFTVNGKLLYYLISWIYRDPFQYPGLHMRLDEIAHALTRKPVMGITDADLAMIISTLKCQFPPERFFEQEKGEIVRSIWREAYRRIAARAHVIGDKYNEYLLQLREIHAIFPTCRYIFVHRDPLEVARSTLRAFKGRPWAPNTMSLALTKWTIWNREWLSFRALVDPTLRFEVSYQSVVDEPEESLRALCEFLGISCSPDYLRMVTSEVRPRNGDHSTDCDLNRDGLLISPSLKETSEVLGYSV